MKVAFIDTVHECLWNDLTEKGFKCIDITHYTRDEILKDISNVEGVVIRSKFTIDKQFLLAAHNLKFIARSGSGLENIDISEAEKKGVKVFNSPEGNCDAVGDHTIGMLLGLLNKISVGNKEVRQFMWNREKNRGVELSSLTVGVIGCGHTGSAFAKRLTGFSCNIIGYDKFKNSHDFINLVPLAEVYDHADVISFHVPYNKETHYYFNDDFLVNCKKPIILLNTSRGKVIETAALVKGLKLNTVTGACLDVLEFEDPSFTTLSANLDFDYLCEAENVVLTPHVAGWTVESYYKLSKVLSNKILSKFKATGSDI